MKAFFNSLNQVQRIFYSKGIDKKTVKLSRKSAASNPLSTNKTSNIQKRNQLTHTIILKTFIEYINILA